MNQKLKNKDKIINLALKNRNQTKDEKKKHMIELLMQKENNAKLNVEHYQLEQEEYRQRESEKTNE